MSIERLIEKQSLTERLRIRAEIRRNATNRKSVQEGKPDKIADLLEEARDRIIHLEDYIDDLLDDIHR